MTTNNSNIDAFVSALANVTRAVSVTLMVEMNLAELNKLMRVGGDALFVQELNRWITQINELIENIKAEDWTDL